MTQYLVAIHRPNGYDGAAVEDEKVRADISALNRDMVAAGVRVFVGGLQATGKAMAVRRQADGKLMVTDGPYLETKEHIGGFWVLETATPEEALEWGRKAAIACRAGVEVRPFN